MGTKQPENLTADETRRRKIQKLNEKWAEQKKANDKQGKKK